MFFKWASGIVSNCTASKVPTTAQDWVANYLFLPSQILLKGPEKLVEFLLGKSVTRKLSDLYFRSNGDPWKKLRHSTGIGKPSGRMCFWQTNILVFWLKVLLHGTFWVSFFLYFEL